MFVNCKSLKVCAGLFIAGFLTIGATADSPRNAESQVLASVTALALAPSSAEPAQDKAEEIAEQVLNAGSELFRSRNAEALANTYTEDGQVHLISMKDGQFNADIRRGRDEVLKLYQDLFEKETTIDATNTVEHARLIGSDLLVINGRFRPEAGKAEFPFVQLRTKQGEDWKLKTLWFFLSPEE